MVPKSARLTIYYIVKRLITNLKTLFKFFLNISYLFFERERKRQRTSRGETEREGVTESKAGSRL